MIKIFACMLFLGVAINAQIREITSNYDRSKGETNVAVTFSASPMSLNYESDSWHLGTRFIGDKVPDALSFTLSIVTTAKHWRLLGADLNVRAFIDGQRVDLGVMKREVGQHRSSSVYESASLQLPTSVVERIANAKTFEVEVADLDRSFKGSDLKKIRYFVETLSPGRSRDSLTRWH